MKTYYKAVINTEDDVIEMPSRATKLEAMKDLEELNECYADESNHAWITEYSVPLFI